MPANRDEPPPYTRYRARKRLLGGKEEELSSLPPSSGGARGEGAMRPQAPRSPRGAGARGGGRSGGSRAGGLRPGGSRWRRWATPKGILLGLLGLVLFWLVLSLVLFLISSHFERT